jgi:hypothetical protein
VTLAQLAGDDLPEFEVDAYNRLGTFPCVIPCLTVWPRQGGWRTVEAARNARPTASSTRSAQVILLARNPAELERNQTVN